MFEGFVHPALAFGALLAAVPLVIHLLNRQRHKPMQWAAMRFVLAAYKKTRRQVQLENLLLLLLHWLPSRIVQHREQTTAPAGKIVQNMAN